jgi:hypothetical protein
MKCGDIIFTSGRSAISRLIQWWTISKWSHVAVVINSEGDFVEATWPKVRVGNIKELYLKGNDDYHEVGILRDPLTYEESLNLHKFMLSKVGTSYDAIGLLSFVLRVRVQNKSFYFCSRLTAEGFEYISRPLIRRKPEWDTPSDIYESLMISISQMKGQ